jgi:hypothetical protein
MVFVLSAVADIVGLKSDPRLSVEGTLKNQDFCSRSRREENFTAGI